MRALKRKRTAYRSVLPPELPPLAGVRWLIAAAARLAAITLARSSFDMSLGRLPWLPGLPCCEVWPLPLC